jgi:putative sporulation protein YtaF
LIAIAVSIDGFMGGFAFGLKRTKIPILSLLIISSWSVVCTMITMLAGHFLTDYIPLIWARIMGAVMLTAIGAMTIIEGIKRKKEYKASNVKVCKIKISNLFKVLNNPLLADVDNQNDIKPSEATLLGLAVAMDASIAAFTLGLAGVNPIFTPFLFGATHFILIGLGNIIATRKVFEFVGVMENDESEGVFLIKVSDTSFKVFINGYDYWDYCKNITPEIIKSFKLLRCDFERLLKVEYFTSDDIQVK